MEQEGYQHKFQMLLFRCVILKSFPVLEDSTRCLHLNKRPCPSTLHTQVHLLPDAECVNPPCTVVGGVMENSSQWCVKGKMQGVCLQSLTLGAVCPSKCFPAAGSVSLDLFCLC